ncbi:MAG TPA: J domain-containing protein [Flavisolibacter sp.]|nr:J domain-containing protein [Flavisolibacter sp.]
MEFVDYYKILEINTSANADDIKKAYRNLARTYHPDLNPNDKEAHKKFQRINEAYEVLGDPEKRARYDLYSKDAERAQRFEQARQQHQQYQQAYAATETASQSEPEGNHFSTFFEALFGAGKTKGRQAQETKSRGQDYETKVYLRLQDVYATHQRALTIKGRQSLITIPAGVEDGQQLQVKGLGAPGNPPGDLYITFHIADDPTFKRNGSDLHTTVDLDLYTAVLGGEVTMSTLSGKLKLKVPPGTQNGTKVRLKGKGFPVYKQEGQYGDLYITYQIKIPTGLSERERALFTQLSQLKK